MITEKTLLEPQSEPSCLGAVISRFLIYADDYVTWNEKIGDWNNNDEFTGNYFEAHEYARKKYGKKYTNHNGL